MRIVLAIAMAVSLSQQQPQSQTPPPVGAKPPAQSGAPASPQTPAAAKPAPVVPQGPYEFTSDIGAFIIVVKADKVAIFDAAMTKLKQAFAASNASANRKRQASGWRILKSIEGMPPPVTPVVPGAAVVPASPPVVAPPAVAPVSTAASGATATGAPGATAAPTPPTTVTYIFLIEPVSKKMSYDPIEILQELLPNEVQAVYDQLKDCWVSATRLGLTELMKMGGGS